MMTARSARGLRSNVYPSTTCWWQLTIQTDSNNRRKSIVKLFSADLSFYTPFFTFFYKAIPCCGGNPWGLSCGTVVDQTWRRQPASNVPYWSTSPLSLSLSIAIHILLVLLAFVNSLCVGNKGEDLPITTIIDLLTVVTNPVFWNLLLYFLSAGLAPCEFLRLCCNY